MALTVADLQTKFSADLSGLNKGIATADRKIKGFASGFAGNAGAFALGGLIERADRQVSFWVLSRDMGDFF